MYAWMCVCIVVSKEVWGLRIFIDNEIENEGFLDDDEMFFVAGSNLIVY